MIDEAPRESQGDGTRQKVDLSVVIPVAERSDNLAELFGAYAGEVARVAETHEFIFTLDGPREPAHSQLMSLKEEHPELRIVILNRSMGEAAALAVGFAQAGGDTILTLPAYVQVEPGEIPGLVEALQTGDADMVVAWRHPRVDSAFNRWQGRVFGGAVSRLTGTKFHDVSCGLRVLRRAVAEETLLYGDLHRFYPILAYERGFKVRELKVRQSVSDAGRRIYGPGVYVRRVLDIATLFFLFKFTKKPLRFFGLLGSLVGGVGAAITGYLGLYRLFGLGGIAGRPLLILGVLLVVLGVQLFSIGLLGEIIIFTHGRRVKEYTVRKFLR